jgi:DNA transposition AAA+ family ATPase
MSQNAFKQQDGRAKDKPTEFAALENLESLRFMAAEIMMGNKDLPKLAVFYGPSGVGKSVSATLLMNQMPHSTYISCRSGWTRKDLLEAICEALGMRWVGKTSNGMVSDIISHMENRTAPFVLDEGDYLCKDSLIETIRDIYDGCRCPFILIGEERLPSKLLKWERFHNRVLRWLPANAATLSDCRKLAGVWAPDLKLTDDILKYISQVSAGKIRRISVNLNLLQASFNDGRGEKITLNDVRSLDLYKGQPTPRQEEL